MYLALFFLAAGSFFRPIALSLFLQAVRSKDESAWGQGMDEELMFAERSGGGGGGVSGMFAEDAMFS